jgi:hypothetical protein
VRAWQGTPVRNRTLTIAALVAVLLGAASCNSRMPILNPEPRSPQEYAHDRDVCIRKHSFGASGSASYCLHCELFAMCMETQMWRMSSEAMPRDIVPCCQGTERSS